MKSNGLRNINILNSCFTGRYVDDIICLVENESNFLCYRNDKHPNITFTVEIEKDKMKPFLDVLITSPEDGFILTSVKLLHWAYLEVYMIHPIVLNWT